MLITKNRAHMPDKHKKNVREICAWERMNNQKKMKG